MPRLACRGSAHAVHAAIVIALTVQLGDGAEYFVDPAGADGTAGTSQSPWRTLQFAADTVGPGDIVTVRPGHYAGFYLSTSGLPESPIEFRAESGAVIDSANPLTADGINLEAASHIVIDGFEVTGMSRAGVRAVGTANDFAAFVTVRNVYAYNNYKWGIFTGHVDDLLIENSRTSGAADEHGIYVSNSGDRPTIRNNITWGNHANGIHMNGDLSLGGDGVISNALVSGNIIYDNGLGGGSGINMDGVQNSRIENNLIYGNHASGISLYRIDGGEPSSGNVVVNNTVHQASDGRWALNIQDASIGNTVTNNILLSDHSYRGTIDISPDSLASFTSDYNVVISRFTTDGGNSVMSLAEWQALTGGDANSLFGAPGQLFVDSTLGDYRLLATAPARDAGDSALAPATDLAGNLRPAGDSHDIGAYEFIESTADFDRDGDVDLDDLAAWTAAFGTAGDADADGDGDADGADFLAWQRQATLSEFSASDNTTRIPEPAGLLFAAIAFSVVSLDGRNWRLD